MKIFYIYFVSFSISVIIVSTGVKNHRFPSFLFLSNNRKYNYISEHISNDDNVFTVLESYFL